MFGGVFVKRSIAFVLAVVCLFTASITTTVFAKEGNFTRGSFCARMVKELNLTADISDMKDFADLPKTYENYKSIMVMCKLGYLNSFEDGTFKPEMSVTRAEAATVITRMIFGVDFEIPSNTAYVTDVKEYDWYSHYAFKAIDSGIMSVVDGKFNGLNPLTEKDINFDVLKSYTGIAVIVNGNKIEFDVEPQIINGRTMVPVRGIFEALNAVVDWDGSTQTVIAKKDNTIIKITINELSFKKNNEMKKLDVPAQIVDGRTLVPVRAIGESFDCTVDWDGSGVTKKVIINSNKTSQEPVIKENDKLPTTESTEEKNAPVVDEPKENISSPELSCSAKVSHSCISIGGKYRIVYAVTVEGKGGEGNYKYKYEIYQNDKITKKISYGKENAYEGELTGTGSCIFKVYVKDANGDEVSKELVLNE